MPEEEFVPLAQRIHIWFAPLRCCEAVLGTFATAGKEVLAATAVARQTIALLETKAEEFGLALQVAQMFFGYVAQLIFRVHEVVAHIDVAIVLYYESVTTCGTECA